MSAVRLAEVAFLIMSVVNLVWQGVSLRRLMAAADDRSRWAAAYRGLLRTARCRVGVAGVYICVGLNALYPRAAVLLVTFGAYTLTLMVWMLNSWMDIRLSKRLMALRSVPPGSPRLAA